jgi:DNA invertase Pin-like site-specific DNA recombinase
VTPEPGASRADRLRRRLSIQIRQRAALEKVLAAAELEERELARDLADELRRPRGAGRPFELDRLEIEERTEQIRRAMRLSLAGASTREIAREIGISRRQVSNILGEKEAA